ncbi:MAG: hypothetical protein FWB80_03710 [Defluviitaleaceae bacterium]|nr:hypothetical protein [Defluviitaleaceae bacterium]
MIKRKIEQNERLPSVVLAGPSGEGKSTGVVGFAHPDYQPGMKPLIGDSNASTTSFLHKIRISPDRKTGKVIVRGVKSAADIAENVRHHIKSFGVPQLRNCISSRSTKKEKWEDFYKSCTENCMEETSATFRFGQLLRGFPDDESRFRKIMLVLIRRFDQKATPSFRDRYNSVMKEKEGKSKASTMLEVLIDQIINHYGDGDGDTPSSAKLVKEICDIISNCAEKCLNAAGFGDITPRKSRIAGNLNGEEFERSILAITNAKKSKATSAACAISEVLIAVPGKGLPIGDTQQPFILYDVVGFDNDGIGRIPERVQEALHAPKYYDAIIYVKSATSPIAKHRDYLEAVSASIRPCKLIVSVTKFDKHEFFDQDEDPTLEEIQKEVTTQKNTTLDIVKSKMDTSSRVIMPDFRDVIFFANNAKFMRNNETAAEFFDKNDPYDLLRTAIANAHTYVRNRITLLSDPDEIKDRIVTLTPFDRNRTDLPHALSRVIYDEFSKIRDRAANIHHWTMDGILWNLLHGWEHQSYALVWENVAIRVYTNIAKYCADYLLKEIQLADGVKASEKDTLRIFDEFKANLHSELRIFARQLILAAPGTVREESDDDSVDYNYEDSDCKNEILNLWKTPKYNKYKIADDLILALQAAVLDKTDEKGKQSEVNLRHMQDLLNAAIARANKTTLARIL